MREGNSLNLEVAGCAWMRLEINKLRAAREANGVNSLENSEIVAEFILSLYVESITYKRKCKEVWMESATSTIFQVKHMILIGIIRRHEF
jgi:hypothetical protein